MLLIFLKRFVRNLFKHGLLNLINILGLSLGITATILITLYVDHEYSFDDFHKNANRIYRFEAQTNSDVWFANLGAEHANELNSGNYPEVEKLVQFNFRSRAFARIGDEQIPEYNVYQTSPGSAFFELFDFEFKEGDKSSALEAPNSVVLTESTAKKYFGNTSALNETIVYDSISLNVTGIVKDLPTHSNFSFEMLLTNPTLYQNEHYHTQSYILLKPNANVESLTQKILDMDVAYNEFHELKNARLIPVNDIHLASDASFGAGGKGDLVQINIFMALGILILLVAVINYINLSFAIFVNKGKEVGMRKILGENNFQLMLRFTLESLLTIFLTTPIILLCLTFLLPVFGEYLNVNLTNILIGEPSYLIGAFLILVLIALLTVVYPSVSLKQTEAGEMIRSRMLLTQGNGVRYRNVLVLIQFVFLFTLGLSAWFMNQQIRYLDNKDKGFEPKNVIKIENAYEIGDYDNYKIFKTQLASNPLIKGVAWGPMMGDGMNPLSYKPEGHDETYENLLSYGVDIDYFDVMNIEIKQGDFKNVLNRADDGQIVSLVNQSFIDRYSWNDNPLGKKIILRPGTENELHRKVSAVFEDFHFYSMKEKITPQIISLRPDPQFVNTNILVRIDERNIETSLNVLEEAWMEVQPELPIEIAYMEESVQKMYLKEKQTSQVGISLSILAIVLSVAGIIGFMVYIIGLKSKEIAIRKVLGASITQIIRLLNKQLFYVILIASVIGISGSYLLVSKWLQDYAYAISINPIAFVVAVLLVYITVYAIIATQTLKSAQNNPVLALKDE